MRINLQWKLIFIFCLFIIIVFAAQSIHHNLIIVTILMVVLALIFGQIASHMISKPLIEISSIARRIAKGDFSKKIYRGSNDEIGDLAKTLNDMTETIKDKGREVSYEEAKLDAVISSMFEGVILTDDKGKIIMMNPSLRKLFFVDSSPEGKRPIEVLHSKKIQDITDNIIRERQWLAIEETLPGKPEDKVVRINGAPVIKYGKTEGVILVFHDITELRRLEGIRQDFVANVSHELRTPLSNIKGYAETLLDGAIKDHKNAKEFTDIIYHESDRLAKIIDDLLDIARIESGKLNMKLSPVEAGTVIKKVSDVLKKSAFNKSITIESFVSEETPRMLADEGRIVQVLLNLVDNAIKYTPENGSVRIQAGRKNHAVQIDVSDTGVGIPEKDIPRIFERFYRVDKARSRELGGTGLGLSIVKHIVQAHGGEVWVKSAQDKGSIFSFTIPVA